MIKQIVRVLCLLALLCANVTFAQDNGLAETAFRQFTLAVVNRDWQALEKLIAPMSDVDRKSYFLDYKRYLSGLPVIDSRESVKEVVFVGKQDSKTVVKFIVAVNYYNPLADPEEGQYEDVHYAFSLNGGRSWWIDPASCNTEEDARAFLKARTPIPSAGL